jgi:hypothetical protein
VVRQDPSEAIVELLGFGSGSQTADDDPERHIVHLLHSL